MREGNRQAQKGMNLERRHTLSSIIWLNVDSENSDYPSHDIPVKMSLVLYLGFTSLKISLVTATQTISVLREK